MPPALIHNLTRAELEAQLGAWGEPAYRARQIWAQLYVRLAAAAEEMNDVPLALRRRLAEMYEFTPLQPVQQWSSQDGRTLKFLCTLADGATLEMVLLTYERRRSACISSQAGCGMGCVFCATGQMGFGRNLSRGEILVQVLHLARLLRGRNEQLTNVVVMGMGEPFHNYEATLSAMDCLTDQEGFGLGARRITISTVGLVPGIRRFSQEKRQINLAVSLHAATDELRSQLVPINRGYPLEMLMDACREYTEATHRRLSFEWALIRDVNDSREQAQALAELLRGLLCHVNLIPLNPTPGYHGSAAVADRANAFRALLAKNGIPCSLRVRRGIDIEAGCGQLASSRGPAGDGAPDRI